MAKRRVLFLIESLSGGGAEKVLYTLIKSIDKEKFDITLCCVNDCGVYTDELKKIVRYVPLIKRQKYGNIFSRLRYLLNFKIVYGWIPLSWVYRLFVPKGCDIEVAFVEGFSTKLLSNSTNKRSSKMAWVHTDLEHNHWIKNIYKDFSEEKRCYHRFDLVIGVSNVASEAVKKIYSLPNTRTVYNPIDNNEILQLAKESIDEKYIVHDRFRICSVGRFVEQKRFDRLLHIVKRLKDEDLDVELWLLGAGPLYGQYVKYVKENDLEENVKFWGFKSNPYPYIKACDMFVCSSIAEGYSTAMTEACILGLPMVTTDCSGMDEILDNGKYGVITANNENSLYEAVKRFVLNPDLLREYRIKSQERSSHFKLSTRMNSIEGLFIE